jgi:hypothetical protein
LWYFSWRCGVNILDGYMITFLVSVGSVSSYMLKTVVHVCTANLASEIPPKKVQYRCTPRHLGPPLKNTLTLHIHIIPWAPQKQRK